MLYTGFSEHELSKIVEILERHQVPYEVTADNQQIEYAQSLIRSKFLRGASKKAELDTSFYSVSFDRNQLKNLLPEEFQNLQKLRIFPEQMVPPESPVEKPRDYLPRQSMPYVGSNPKTALLIIASLFCLCWAYFSMQD